MGRIEQRIEAAGWRSPESSLLALAVYATLSAPAGRAAAETMVEASSSLGDLGLAREIAGVVFAFNTVNRVADARRVRLEYRFLRELKPVRGWVERRFAQLTGLVYDLSYTHEPRFTPDQILDQLSDSFRPLGAPDVPDLFTWFSSVPRVLEGISGMIEVSARNARGRSSAWKEAVAVAVASQAMTGSSLRPLVDRWLQQDSLPDCETLLTQASSSACGSEPGLVPACRRYVWRVSNEAYTITDEDIRRLRDLGLSDAEVLDLTLGSALFSALAIVEPLVVAVGPISVSGARSTDTIT